MRCVIIYCDRQMTVETSANDYFAVALKYFGFQVSSAGFLRFYPVMMQNNGLAVVLHPPIDSIGQFEY